MKNLTGVQWMAIAAAVIVALSGASAQLTDVVGPHTAKAIVGLANLCGTVLNGIIAVLAGQGYIAQAVNNMKGVDSIQINKDAPKFLADMATDPNSKVETTKAAGVNP